MDGRENRTEHVVVEARRDHVGSGILFPDRATKATRDEIEEDEFQERDSGESCQTGRMGRNDLPASSSYHCDGQGDEEESSLGSISEDPRKIVPVNAAAYRSGDDERQQSDRRDLSREAPG